MNHIDYYCHYRQLLTIIVCFSCVHLCVCVCSLLLFCLHLFQVQVNAHKYVDVNVTFL